MKTIPNYGDYYAATEDGRIFSIRKNKYMLPEVDRHRYLRLHLSIAGKSKFCLVHRLVAQTFIDNPNNLPQINHVDGNKQNNNVDNLEWCTCKHNVEHARAIGTHTGRPTREVLGVCDATGMTFWLRSLSEAARSKYKFRTGGICACCRGKSHTHRGLRWYYYDELPDTA